MVCPRCAERLTGLCKPSTRLIGLVVERRHSHEAERVAIERRALHTRNPDTPEFHALEAERREAERRHIARGHERRAVAPWGLRKDLSDASH